MTADAADAIRFVYVTFPADPDAPLDKVLREALEKRLCACVNVHNIQSAYVWDGAITHDPERVLIFKTTAGREAALREYLAQAHPYTVPCVASWEPTLNEPYAAWLLVHIHGGEEQS